MASDSPPNNTLDLAEQLRVWRIGALNSLLITTTAIGAAVLAFTLSSTIRNPERWPVTLVYVVVFMLIVVLTAGRRIHYPVRAWGLVIIGCIVVATSLVVGGLAGDGRIYLMIVPALTLTLLGARPGLCAGIISLLIYSAVAIAAEGGWLTNWLFIQDNPLHLSAWLQEGVVVALGISMLIALQWQSGRFLSDLAHERTQLAIKARDSEQRYRVLSELAPDFAFGMQVTADGELVHRWVTDTFTRTTGFTHEELTELDWTKLVHPQDISLAVQASKRLLSGETDVTELRLLSKQGDVIWVRNYAKPVWDDSEGRVTLIHGAAQDITHSKLAETKLQQAYEEVETRIQERTAELAQANDDLQAEIAEREQAERALRESEEMYRTLVELIPDPVVVMQGDRLRFVSPAFTRLLGYTRQEVDEGFNPFVLLQPQDQEAFHGRLQDRIAGRQLSKTYQIDAVAKDGTVIPCETSATLIQFEGQPAVLAIARDITERRQAAQELERARDELETRVEERTAELARINAELEAEIVERRQIEEALRESEEQFRLIAETSIDVIFQLDTEGMITYCSPAVEQITGVPPEEAIGTAFADYFAPEEIVKAQKAFQAIAKGDKVPMLGLRTSSRAGAPLYLEFSIVPIMQGTEMTGIQGIARDVTSRTRAEESLRESEETVRALLNAPTEIMVLVDRQGSILALNEACAEALGGTQVELLGQDVFDRFRPEVAKSRREWRDKVLLSGEPVRFEDQRDSRWYVNRVYPMFDAQGTVARLAVFSQDITQQRKAERQVAGATRLAAMGQMATALAHEINNPLQAIQNNLELAMDFDLARAEQSKHLQIVRQEIDRLIEINRRILDFARPSDDAPVPVSVGDLFQRTLDLVGRQLQRAGVRVTTALDPDLPPIMAAPNQIIQVLMNLFLNAVEAMSEGGHIQATAQTAEEDGTVILSLANDGPPIPEDDINRLFDPFFTTKPDSTGLGLTVSYGIVQRHGGTMDVRNLEDEQGVVFTVKLPISQEDAL